MINNSAFYFVPREIILMNKLIIGEEENAQIIEFWPGKHFFHGGCNIKQHFAVVGVWTDINHENKGILVGHLTIKTT